MVARPPDRSVPFEILHLALVLLGRRANTLDDGDALEGFLDEVVRPLAHRGDRDFDRD